METRIMFLIIALLSLYLMFTAKGQEWLKKYIGLDITPVADSAKNAATSTGATISNMTGGITGNISAGAQRILGGVTAAINPIEKVNQGVNK